MLKRSLWLGFAIAAVSAQSFAEEKVKADPNDPYQDFATIESAERAALQKDKFYKIVLAGDSTVANNYGWGGRFCSHHIGITTICVNWGRSGRSTVSYRLDGSWDAALNEVATPGYAKTLLFIQFGHNDMPGKPGISSNLATEFPANISRFIAEARAKGADPVLLTPLSRRVFVDNDLVDSLEPWAEAVRQVGTKENVPVLDLHKVSMELFAKMGKEEAAKLGPTPADTTHLNDEGAKIVAELVSAELARVLPKKVSGLVLKRR